MRFLLNLLGAILGGGLVTAIAHVLAGLVCWAAIVRIPIGLQCFELAGLALFPFGKDFTSEGKGALSFLFNLFWPTPHLKRPVDCPSAGGARTAAAGTTWRAQKSCLQQSNDCDQALDVDDTGQTLAFGSLWIPENRGQHRAHASAFPSAVDAVRFG